MVKVDKFHGFPQKDFWEGGTVPLDRRNKVNKVRIYFWQMGATGEI